MASPQFKVRLDDDRRARWAARAQQNGQPLGTWLRDVADRAARSDADPAEIRAELAALRRELNAVGVNLNQLAARANSGVPVAIEELQRELRQLRQTRRLINQVLHR